MKNKKHLLRLILSILGLNLITPLVKCQYTESDVLTLNVENVRASVLDWRGLFDKIIIESAPGITWLRISSSPPYNNRPWEASEFVLFDGVPIIGSTIICPKEPMPEVGPKSWRLVNTVFVAAWGKGTVRLRRINLAPDPPYAQEGEYIEKNEVIDGYGQSEGRIDFDPVYVQPGNTVNIRVTIPPRMQRHITGVVLKLPGPPDSDQNTVTLPYDPDGVYNFAWRIPNDPSYAHLNAPSDKPVKFEAYSNKPDENGRSYLITYGTGYMNISTVLDLEMFLQDKKVPSGTTVTWDNNKPRKVSANWATKGRGPYKVKWTVNGKEIPTLYSETPGRQGSTLEDQNALTNDATIICDVTDANSNKASGVIYVGVINDISFQFNVQGVKVDHNSSVNWVKDKSKLVTINPINGGRFPLKGKWYINDIEAASKTLVNRFDQIEDQEVLNKARSITYEVTDANGVVSKGTIFIGNPGSAQDTVKVPTGPVGPAPVPPPLTGDPDRKPNPEVDWNNKPWLNQKVQQCTREYLQRIVLYMENEIRKWENTGLSQSKQNALFTSIDDWGRLLNQYITASGGVDGAWDNPTHYVWSVYNKQSATVRYGRTVEYYVKYECNLLDYSQDDINSAIKDLAGTADSTKLNDKQIKDANDNLNNLLNQARSLYSMFNTNYNKFFKEVNNQASNVLQNEIIALCLASAQKQLNDHSINKDTLDATGNSLIAQSSVNKKIDMFSIIRILSEVQGQSDDMNKKMNEMRTLLASRGGDIDEIITNGQNLIAQGNVNPEFAQDGGVNVEFYGDGIDNIGNGLQDYLYGNVRKGNVLIIVWDNKTPDDIFEVSVSGKGSMGLTPPGGRRNFDINLSPGTYTITIKGVYTDPNATPCTFGIQVWDRDKEIPVYNRDTHEVVMGGDIDMGKEIYLTITVM